MTYKTELKSELPSNSQILNQTDLFEKDILQEAYLTLPRFFIEHLLDSQRVVLIANNPAISTEILDSTLQQDDILVLFNHFIQADYFTSSPLAQPLLKLLFFRQIGDSLLHFGLPPRRNNLPAIEQMLKDGKVGFLFGNEGYHFPTVEDDPNPDDDPIDDSVTLVISNLLRQAISDDYYTRILNDMHPVVADYPVYENIHSSAPSSGFLMYRLMLAVQAYLKDLYQHPLEIVLLGFNHNKSTEYFWHGHNWDFERQEMSNLPDNVTRIKTTES